MTDTSGRLARLGAAGLFGSALVVLLPVLAASAIAFFPVEGPDQQYLLLAGWSLFALVLSFVNLIGGIVLWHRPRPLVVRWLWVASAAVLVTCPLFWALVQ